MGYKWYCKSGTSRTLAPIAQSVEHFHGKEGVISSNLIGSSILNGGVLL